MEQRRIKKYKAAAIREEHGGLWSRWWPVLAVAVMMWSLVFVAAHQIVEGETGAPEYTQVER